MAKIQLVKFGQIVGSLYLPDKPTAVVIYAKGGPSLGDDGHSPIWPVCRKYQVALLVPDYIGYCRSDGVFNFKNCVATLTESEDFLKGQTAAGNLKTGREIHLNFDQIILLGSSWGGAIVPFLEKYRRSQISQIGLISPLTNWISQGKTKYQEEDEISTMKLIQGGFGNIYRGFDKSEWPEIFAGKNREFNPIDNVALLGKKNVYIIHGNKDQVIHWSKSREYYLRLKAISQKKVLWKLLPNATHAPSSRIKGCELILKEFLGRS